MTALLACDLDQTLIFSRHHFHLVPGVPEPEIALVERIDGVPSAYSSAASLRLLAALHRTAVFVPVTTRTLAQYQRIDLGVRPRYAVAANGGHLLVDGVPDPAWAAEVAARLAGACAPLAEMAALAGELGAEEWVRLVREADGLFVYLVAHTREAIPDLTRVAERVAAGGWALSRQGRKVYLVPEPLTKQTAVAEVARRAGATRVFAAGDSVLDLPMLTAADRAVRPAHGELHEQGWQAPHLTVTGARGLLAADELLGLLDAWVRSPCTAAPSTAAPSTAAPSTAAPVQP
ncbi:phosphoserine phosphatase [Frankia sp. EI5c]|uniref:sucrose-6-phosphate hydrolase n=1 Tax=Frankia sp. EI5c TaxID=683316 RepID=UPI0007C292B6|nr:sucrose-6-phosphate hydrolase [Frankia sp. EI5c]OAA20567.1 phosphoserine phosphatase [Frankia sp. EI5c]